jgi:hypothetical protein
MRAACHTSSRGTSSHAASTAASLARCSPGGSRSRPAVKSRSVVSSAVALAGVRGTLRNSEPTGLRPAPTGGGNAVCGATRVVGWVGSGIFASAARASRAGPAQPKRSNLAARASSSRRALRVLSTCSLLEAAAAAASASTLAALRAALARRGEYAAATAGSSESCRRSPCRRRLPPVKTMGGEADVGRRSGCRPGGGVSAWLSGGDEACTPVAGVRGARGLPWIGTTTEAMGMDTSKTSIGIAVAAGRGVTSGDGRVGRECSRSRGGVGEERAPDSTASWARHSAALALRAASAASSIFVDGPWRHLEGAARELRRPSWRGGGIWPG